MRNKLIKKVFISSTVHDLEEERNAILDSFLTLSNDYIEFQPYLSEYPHTFNFNQSDFSENHSYDVCLNKIKQCHYFILLINQRYNLQPEFDVSITNLEYRKAKELFIPCLTFINKNTENARYMYKKGNPQNWIEDSQLKIFDFISEIITSKRSNWRFVYSNKNEIIEQLKVTLFSFDHSSFISESPADNICVKRSDSFTKEWIIINDGCIPWKNRRMKCTSPISGDLVPERTSIDIPTVYPGEQYILKIKYHAVSEGVYESRWRMFDENGDLSFPDDNIRGLWITVQITK